MKSVDDFWTFLDAVEPRTDDAVIEALARLPIPRIARFHRILMELTEEALTWRLWAAADIIFHPWGASMDTFVYFRLWLIGQGRETFERAVRDPDSLAGNAFLQRFATLDRDGLPEWEALMCCAESAFDRVLEKLPPAVAAGVEPPDDLELRPRETPWDSPSPYGFTFARLTRLFVTADRDAYLRDLADVLAGYWGNVVGVYLHGSSALGGWDPQRSDVDVLAVVARDGVPEAQLELGQALAAVGPLPPGGLELSVITAETAASLTDLSFVVHVRATAERKVVLPGAGHAPDPDLLLHGAVCREHGIAVVGPPALEVFGPIGRDRVLAAMRAELRWGLDNAPAAYTVLNACRALRYAEDGRLCSKVEGGEWFLARHPGDPIVTAVLDHHAPPPPLDVVADFVARLPPLASHAQ
jgi:hypothetical protein